MRETTAPLRLAELISARLCHDLGGTIGTLAAALEMAVGDAPETTEVMSLAAEAAVQLRNRLKLLRAAWGPLDHSLDLPALSELAKGLPGTGSLRTSLEALPADTVFAPGVARMVLNLLLLAREGLPAGGEVALAGTPADLVVSIAGPRAAWPKGLMQCLASDANAWAAVQEARTLQVPLTALLARSLGLRLSLLMPGGPGDSLPLLRLSEF